MEGQTGTDIPLSPDEDPWVTDQERFEQKIMDVLEMTVGELLRVIIELRREVWNLRNENRLLRTQKKAVQDARQTNSTLKELLARLSWADTMEDINTILNWIKETANDGQHEQGTDGAAQGRGGKEDRGRP